MPLINRIEVANFMNSRREEPWRADWPHAVFELNCDSSVISITNGRGKSTMVHLLFAMLRWSSRDLGDLRRTHFAPSRTGRFTHARIEVKVDTVGGDLVAVAGGALAGQTMVFGMYGNSGLDDKWVLYSYRGSLETCPVAKVDGGRVHFIGNAEFLEARLKAPSAFPANQREDSPKLWRDHVSTWFEMGSLEQQLEYQRAKGGEGSNTYFDAPRMNNMPYSTALFYDRLAPELLRDVMGSKGEDDERGIEDTIHNATAGVIRAKRETADHAQKLKKAEEVLTAYAYIQERAGATIEARKKWNDRHAELSVEYAVLRNLLIEAPLPGIPVPPAAAFPEFARHLVMQEDQWYLPDKALGLFTGEDAGAVNQRADRIGGITTVKALRAQVLEIACDSFSMPARGPAPRLYGKDAALAWLARVDNFRSSWSGPTAATSVAGIFDWAEEKADTNAARIRSRALGVEIAKLQSDLDGMNQRYTQHQTERNNLRTRQEQIGAQQTAFRQMSVSELFTAEELQEPAQTGERAKNARIAAQRAADQHTSKVAELDVIFAVWKTVRQRYGETLPRVIVESLEAAVATARDALQSANDHRDRARGQRKALAASAARCDQTLASVKGRHEAILQAKPMQEAFQRLFPNERAEGLEQSVRSALATARQRQQEFKQKRSALAGPLAALTSFRLAQPDTDPAAWLGARDALRLKLTDERRGKVSALGDVRRRRADLDHAAVAPGEVAHKVLAVAGGQSTPLHDTIRALALDNGRAETVLSLFSALLFTPVYETVDEAAIAAANLAASKVEAPVFVRAEVETFCREATIAYERPVAHTWLVGRRTRPVDCLLDPNLVPREKAELEEEAKRLESAIASIDSELATLAPDSEAAKLAQRARDAVAMGVEASVAEVDAALATVEEEMPQLVARASDDHVEAIRGSLKWAKLLGTDTEESVEASLASAVDAAAAARAAIDDNETVITTLEGEADVRAETLRVAQESALAVAELRRVQTFIDDPTYNPSFMESASTRKQTLADELELASRRTSFDFSLAELFAKSDENTRRETEERLRWIEQELRNIERQQPDRIEEIKQRNEKKQALAPTIVRIDEFARSLMSSYRDLAGALKNPAPKSAADLEGNFLYDAAPGIRDAANLEEAIRLIEDLLNDPVVTRSGVDAELEALMRERDQTASELKREVNKVIDDRQRLRLTEREVMDLQRAIEDPAVITMLHGVTKDNYNRNVLANQTAQEHLDFEWTALQQWLETFTRNLKRNFEIMRREFLPPKGEDGKYVGAGFEIDGKIAEITDVRATLYSIIEMIERDEALSQSTGDDADRDLRQQRRRSLRDKIRLEFYSRVVVDPTIKVYIPSVTKVRPLKMEKNMLSSGQSIAMTLLWIVKMASYVTERDLSRQGVQGAHLRRLRAAKSSFVIIDGAFSHLSDRALIDDALAGIGKTRGSFQLIVTGHDPNYENDYTRFPVFLVGRELNDNTMFVEASTNKLVPAEERGLHSGAMATQRVRALPDPSPTIQ